MTNFSELESIIGYTFNNKNHLRLALTHSSYANEKGMARTSYNERIEFLGDAVLELVSSDYLYRNYPDMMEGNMTKLRAKLVCEEALAASAREINLGTFLMLGKGEEVTGGRTRDSILSDAFESLIGAIYLDSGIEKAKDFINRFVLNDIENKTLFVDSKTTLQEIVQSRFRQSVTYKVINESGPEHNKQFEIAAFIGDRQMASGTGRSKKSAAQNAAYKTMLMIKDL